MVLLTVLAGTCVAASPAAAGHDQLELASIRPPGNGVFYDAFLRAMSRDGKRVFFLTGRGLVPGDNDSTHDVYERSGGVTKLISTGNDAGESHYAGMSEDESTIFVSYPGLYSSIYAYRDGTRTQVAPSGVSLTTFEGSSADGSRVFFGTAERLVPADLDSEEDIYERSNGAYTLISTGPTGGNGPYDAFMPPSGEFWRPYRDLISRDGNHLFFRTQESLVPEDTDSSLDLYERAGTTTRLVSTGPTGGNGNYTANFTHASRDGARVFFETDESLVAADTDACPDPSGGPPGCNDIYMRENGGTTLVSTGPAATNAPADAGGVERSFLAEDGSRLLFPTAEALVVEDTDSFSDIYEWHNGTVILRSIGAGAAVQDASPDALHFVYTSGVDAAVGDSNGIADVYKYSNGVTTQESVGPAGSGVGDICCPEADISSDGTRSFFLTARTLTGSDTDSRFDYYERHASQTTHLTTGPAGGNGNFNIYFVQPPLVSEGGRAVAFETAEKLMFEDPDAEFDVYVRRATGFEHPAAASSLNVSLVPAFRQTISGSQCTSRSGLPSTHGPPLAFTACQPPAYVPVTMAHMGPNSVGGAALTAVPGVSSTEPDEADLAISLGLTDVQSSTGGDYTPNAGGTDVTLVTRLRISDTRNGSALSDPGTVIDINYAARFDCAATSDPGTGSTCSASTSADAITPGAIVEGKENLVQAFRVRLNDAGQNNSPGDTDDRVFAQQGIYIP